MNLRYSFECLLFVFFLSSSNLSGQYIESTFQSPPPPPYSNYFYLNGMAAFSTIDTPPPAYGIFWIFDDGNFMYVPEEQDTVSSSHVQYDNAWPDQASPIQVVAYLTEKYSDDDPPPPPDGLVNGTSSNGKATPMSPGPIGKINPNKKLALDVNHTPRANFDNVYAISYKAHSDKSQTLWFFYGSKENVQNGEDLAVIDNLFSYERSHLPYYARTHPSPTDNSTTKLENTNGINYDNFQNGYAGYIKYDVPDTFSVERHIFYAFKTKFNSNNYTDSLFNFLVILTDSTDVAAIDFGKNSTHPMKERVDNLFDVQNNFAMIGTEYVSEIMDTTLPLEASHDPNQLCLTNTCFCTKNDSLCKLNFSLQICNRGNIAANVTTTLTDAKNQGLECLNIYKIEKLWDGTTCPLNSMHSPFSSFPNKPLDHTTFTLPCLIPRVDSPYNEPKCVEVHFTTNGSSSVCKRDNLNGLIEARIQFGKNPYTLTTTNKDCCKSNGNPLAFGSGNSGNCNCSRIYSCDCTRHSYFICRTVETLKEPLVAVMLIMGIGVIGYFISRRRPNKNKE